MPEGPSLIIAKEAMQIFCGKKILTATGNAKIDMALLTGKKLRDFKTWGKQLFIFVEATTVRIHFLLFGSYSINEQTKPERSTRLVLQFKKGSLHFYTC